MPSSGPREPDSSFPGLRVRIDPWEVEYGSEVPVTTAAPDETAPDIDLGTEMPASGWRAVSVAPQPLPPRVLFVDGIRRLDARLLVTRDERVCHGGLGTYGAGAVLLSGGRASWHREHIGRLAVLGSNERFPAPLSLGRALEFVPVSTPRTEPDGPLLEIHAQMRAAEERLARELADTDALVIVDGPLTFGDAARGQAVGFVKRLFKLYVPAAQMSVVGGLRVGQRSPIFAVTGAGRFARLSWFVRLAEPLRVDSELTGLARLEVSAVIGLEHAQRLADATAALLPTLVPSRARDPRAPQNLLPIGALEAHLKRQFGDSRLVRRRLAALIAKESTRV